MSDRTRPALSKRRSPTLTDRPASRATEQSKPCRIAPAENKVKNKVQSGVQGAPPGHISSCHVLALLQASASSGDVGWRHGRVTWRIFFLTFGAHARLFIVKCRSRQSRVLARRV